MYDPTCWNVLTWSGTHKGYIVTKAVAHIAAQHHGCFPTRAAATVYAKRLAAANNTYVLDDRQRCIYGHVRQ